MVNLEGPIGTTSLRALKLVLPWPRNGDGLRIDPELNIVAMDYFFFMCLEICLITRKWEIMMWKCLKAKTFIFVLWGSEIKVQYVVMNEEDAMGIVVEIVRVSFSQ